MSISIMNKVWQHSQLKGSALLLLLAIADNTNEHGEAWPGMDYLAAKTRLSVRQVQRLVKELNETQELAVAWRGNGRGSSNFYFILVGCSPAEIAAVKAHAKAVTEAIQKGLDRSPFYTNWKGVKLAPIGAKKEGFKTPPPEMGDTKGDTAMAPEPLTIKREEEEGNSPPARADRDPPLVTEADLAPAADVVRAAGKDVTDAVLARLRRMVIDAEPYAQQAGATGAQWVEEALGISLGVAQDQSLLPYASAVLTNWIQNGHPEKKPLIRKSRDAPGRTQIRLDRQPVNRAHEAVRNYMQRHGMGSLAEEE